MIATQDVDLRSLAGDNDLVLLKMVEGSLAAGGRGGGFGERRVVMVSHFHYRDGACEKLFEASDERTAGQYEVPFHVARLPVVLQDGTQAMGYGVIDPDLVRELVSRMAENSLP